MTLAYDPYAPAPQLGWDTVASDGLFDLSLSGTSLTADAQLHTAILLCLFTDARSRDDDDLPGDFDDRRGWVGDLYDVRSDQSETALGSRIWLYERSVLNDDTARLVAAAARESLLPLVDQGLVATYTVSAEVNRTTFSVDITVECFSKDGSLRYDQKFNRTWQQTIA